MVFSLPRSVHPKGTILTKKMLALRKKISTATRLLFPSWVSPANVKLNVGSCTRSRSPYLPCFASTWTLFSLLIHTPFMFVGQQITFGHQKMYIPFCNVKHTFEWNTEILNCLRSFDSESSRIQDRLRLSSFSASLVFELRALFLGIGFYHRLRTGGSLIVDVIVVPWEGT